MRTILIALFFLISFAPSANSDEYDRGLEAANNYDFIAAAKIWMPVALNGDARAQFNLGVLYEAGRGVDPDLKKARELYELASQQGHPKAKYFLGGLY